MNESNDNSQELSEEKNNLQLNPIARLIGVFTSPQRTFEDIAVKPNWVFPLIIMLLITMLITQILIPAIKADQKSSPQYEALMQNQDLSPEDLERMQEMSQKAIENFASLGAGVSVIISALIATAVLLFVGNVILGGTAKFVHLFSIFCWAGLVGTLGYLVKLPLSLSKMTLKIYLGPAILFPENLDSALFKIAAALDVFVLWRVALIAIGFAALYRFSMEKSIAAVGGLYALNVALGIIFSTMF